MHLSEVTISVLILPTPADEPFGTPDEYMKLLLLQLLTYTHYVVYR